MEPKMSKERKAKVENAEFLTKLIELRKLYALRGSYDQKSA